MSSETNRATLNPVTGFLVVVLLAAAHGAAGYQQSSVVVYASILGAALMSAAVLLRRNFYIHASQLFIAAAILALMLFPAARGLVLLGSRAGVTFLVCNLTAFLLFTQVVHCYGEAGRSRIASTFFVAGLVSLALGAYLMFDPLTVGGLTFGRQGYFRPVGTFSTPNRFGEATAAGALAAAYLFVRRGQRLRHGVAAGVLVLGTLASGSKGVILGLVAALPLFIFLTPVLVTRGFWRSALALLPLAAVATYQVWDYVVVATKLDLILGGAAEVGSGRAEIWAAGLSLYAAGPPLLQLLGHGATYFVRTVGYDAHSTYVYLLVDYGLLSLVWIPALLSYIIAVILRRGGTSPEMILGAALVVFCLVRGVAMPTVFTSFNFAMLAFWAGVALLVMPTRSSPAAHAR